MNRSWNKVALSCEKGSASGALAVDVRVATVSCFLAGSIERITEHFPDVIVGIESLGPSLLRAGGLFVSSELRALASA
jgi:hypothetical protein